MEILLDALRQMTPAIIVALIFLGVSIAFFLYYWFSISPQKGTLEWIAISEKPRPRLSLTLERHPMNRTDCLPLFLITTIYAVTAFFQLGDTTNVQSWVKFQPNQSISFSFGECQEVEEIRYFTGTGTGSYLLEYTEDGVTWNSIIIDQSYNTLLKWKTVEVEEEDGKKTPVALTGKIFKITAQVDYNAHSSREYLELGELAFFDADGALIEITYVEESGVALFDEQDLVKEYFWLNSAYFDEIYHPRTAKENIDHVYPYEVSHPPLGKLIISLGIRLFGMTPFGWRFMGTLFGVLMLPILYIFLKNMFGRTAVAICGTTLLATEFMHLTQTRIATIDTYGVFFILAMYYFMYRWLTIPPSTKLRESIPSLFLCGLMFGIGVACKWTVIYGGVGLALLWLIGLITRHREWNQNARPRFSAYLLGTIGLSIIFFIVIPVMIYVASYLPYAIADGKQTFPELLQIVWDNQVFMLTYHQGVHDVHPYESRWYMWLVDARPILYFREMDQIPGMKAAFSAFNNPLISWTGLLCVVLTAIQTVRRRCGKALFLLIGYLSQIVPWIFIGRTTFAYHYFPSILFCVLAISYAMNDILTRQKGCYRLVVYGFTGCAVGLYAAFYPVLIGLYVPTWYTSNFLRWFPSWPI